MSGTRQSLDDMPYCMVGTVWENTISQCRNNRKLKKGQPLKKKLKESKIPLHISVKHQH